ncbi:MAG: 6-carboxytetrahydropterin synthase [Bacteroidetes bacterium]|nr:6-carboxytetrahydropterin synthase [Bacteroidota bacterium]
MVYLTRKEHFNAAHKLYNSSWTAEKNIEVFGKGANENWYGHNYDLWVTVKGKPNPDTGFIMNMKTLSKIIKENILEKLDHSNLNMDVDFIPEHVHPSTEHLTILIWEQLEPLIRPHCALHCVKLQVTEMIYTEYFGEG